MTAKKRGKPFTVGNNYGKGRPPRSHNKATLLYDMIKAEGEDIVRTVLRLAKRGDRQCLKMLMERSVARCTENPIRSTYRRSETARISNKPIRRLSKQPG